MRIRASIVCASLTLALGSCDLEPGEIAPQGDSPFDPTTNVGLAVSPGTYTLVRAGSGKCLDVYAAGSADGTNIQQYSCNGTGAQSSGVEDQGGGAYRVVSVPTGKCVDVNARGTADGTNIQLWSCNGSVAQSFRIEDRGGGYSQLVNTNANKCMDVNASSADDGANVQLWTCNGTA